MPGRPIIPQYLTFARARGTSRFLNIEPPEIAVSGATIGTRSTELLWACAFATCERCEAPSRISVGRVLPGCRADTDDLEGLPDNTQRLACGEMMRVPVRRNDWVIGEMPTDNQGFADVFRVPESPYFPRVHGTVTVDGALSRDAGEGQYDGSSTPSCRL